MPTPRKRKQPLKLKKINVSEKSQWREILKDIDKDEIPIELLLSIKVRLIDGTEVNIDVKELLQKGHDPIDIQNSLDLKFQEIDAYIEDIDFYVSIDEVVKTVKPLTDQILKDL